MRTLPAVGTRQSERPSFGAVTVEGNLDVNRKTSLWTSIRRSPLLWGAILTAGFYGLLYGGVLRDERIIRYFASHPVEYVECTLFMIGLASLLLKAGSLLRQSYMPKVGVLGPTRAGGQSIDDAPRLLARLGKLPRGQQESYLVTRLREGLEHVHRKGSAETLDDELKYLSEVDEMRAHSTYSLVTIVIWAIPMLGFLGTVIGITMAIANLAPQNLEESMIEVTAALGIAFDTTALALALSIVLMFVKFATEKAENRLLADVDERASDELAGRFAQAHLSGDPQLVAVRRMADAVVQATERVVNRQAELWQATISAAHERWSELSTNTQQQIEGAFQGALVKGLEAHAGRIAEADQARMAQEREHLGRFHETMSQSSESTQALHAELVKHGEVLLQIVTATGDVIKLEDALNRNLDALSGTHGFEETLHSLSAAIHLLSGRLGHLSGGTPHVDIKRQKSEGQAA